jgi:antitoxin PrlF
MTQLTITAKGQVTLRKDLLKHLGLKPGDKLDISLMPDGRAEIRAARPQGTVDGFIGLLAGKAKRALTIEEMNKISAEGWAGTDEDHR